MKMKRARAKREKGRERKKIKYNSKKEVNLSLLPVNKLFSFSSTLCTLSATLMPLDTHKAREK